MSGTLDLPPMRPVRLIVLFLDVLDELKCRCRLQLLPRQDHLQQVAHLRHRQRRRFFPPSGSVARPRSDAPENSTPCGGATPPSPAPHTGLAPPRLCSLRSPTRLASACHSPTPACSAVSWLARWTGRSSARASRPSCVAAPASSPLLAAHCAPATRASRLTKKTAANSIFI